MSKISGRESIFCSEIYQVKNVGFMVTSGMEAFASQTLDEMCLFEEDSNKLKKQVVDLSEC